MNKKNQVKKKTAEVLLDADVQCLPKFDIYQDTAAPSCFKNHKNT